AHERGAREHHEQRGELTAGRATRARITRRGGRRFDFAVGRRPRIRVPRRGGVRGRAGVSSPIRDLEASLLAPCHALLERSSARSLARLVLPLQGPVPVVYNADATPTIVPWLTPPAHASPPSFR